MCIWMSEPSPGRTAHIVTRFWQPLTHLSFRWNYFNFSQRQLFVEMEGLNYRRIWGKCKKGYKSKKPLGTSLGSFIDNVLVFTRIWTWT